MSEIFVSSIWKYPITGGPGVSVEGSSVIPGGILDDRTLVLGEQSGHGFERVGSKQAPRLLQMRYSHSGATVLLDEVELELPPNDLGSQRSIDGVCVEFGDRTPVSFVGKEYDDAFSAFLDREVRLLRKTGDWQIGQGVPPRDRANAPLHIIGDLSVDDIAAKNESTADARRYKPNIVLSGLGAHQELEHIGKILQIGNSSVWSRIQISRGTPRCPVPSYDPETGENLKDISLRTMPKSANRDNREVASAGVYAYQLGQIGIISVFDSVKLV